MALYISISRCKDIDQSIYNKPNYNHHSHTINICYWPSSGKKRQFSPGFEKRRRAKESTTNTQQNRFRKALSTNIATTININKQQAFILIIIKDTYLKILELLPSSSQNPTLNIILFPNSIECVKQRIDKGIGKQVSRK